MVALHCSGFVAGVSEADRLASQEKFKSEWFFKKQILNLADCWCIIVFSAICDATLFSDGDFKGAILVTCSMFGAIPI